MSAWKAAPSAFTARSGGKSRRASIIRDKVRTVHDFSLLINLNDVILHIILTNLFTRFACSLEMQGRHSLPVGPRPSEGTSGQLSHRKSHGM